MDGDDSALYVVQCAHGHSHACAPCGVHNRAPCELCARNGVIPAVIPAVTQVTAGSVHAQRILYEAEAALHATGLKTGDMMIHPWQLENIATAPRVRDGSWQGLKIILCFTQRMHITDFSKMLKSS